MKIIIINMILCIGVGFVSAQNLKVDLEKMSVAYQSLDKIKIETITTTNLNNGKINKDSYTIWKWGDYFLQQNKKYEVFRNQNFLLFITHKDKHIAYTDANNIPKYNTSLPDSSLQKMIKSYMNKYDSIRYLGEDNNSKSYIIYASSFGVAKVEMTFNTTTHLIEQMIYYYNTEVTKYTMDKVKIDFDYTFLDKYPSQLFDDKKYISIKKKEVFPSANYSSYSISQKKYYAQ